MTDTFEVFMGDEGKAGIRSRKGEYPEPQLPDPNFDAVRPKENPAVPKPDESDPVEFKPNAAKREDE